jgi:hypothetical protein
MVACPRYHAYGRAVEQVIAQQEAKAAVQIWCLSDSFWPFPALRSIPKAEARVAGIGETSYPLATPTPKCKYVDDSDPGRICGMKKALD